MKIARKDSSLQKIKAKGKSFNQQKILASVFTAVPFDVKLAFNPYLQNEEKYQYLIYKLKQFNTAVSKGLVTDSYEAMVQDRLRALMGTLSNMLTRQLHIDKMNQIYDWFKSEQKLMEQRRDQGNIRYKITKEYLQQSSGKQQKPSFIKSTDSKAADYKSMILSQQLKHTNLPYIKKWRTAHKQLQSPDVRLNQYKRKSLNFNPLQFSPPKQIRNAPRITYPKIQRLKFAKQYDVQEGLADEANKNETVATTNVENPQLQNNQNSEQKPQNPQAVPEAPQQPQVQDFGIGLGQQPQQPQQQQQIEQQDKLAPRLKSYILEPRTITFDEKLSHNRMNDRYLKIYSDHLRKQTEDAQMVELMDSWAARKSQLDKEIMKRIQNMGIKFEGYKHSYQQPQKEQVFGAADAIKYGLSKTTGMRNGKVELDLSQGLELPNINNKSQMYEKSIRKDKLKSLKKKFGKLLDIKQYESRQIAQSMCQVSQKRKGFSQILRKHSKSKQRLKQLDEVIALKQKLARSKVSVDITALSSSLCVPEDEELPQSACPQKNLLSNPYWVQPAKKKKKK